MSQRLFLPREQVLSNLGAIGAGYKLYFYETDTDTPKDTYSDTALTVPNTNPVVADSAGRIGDIYVSSSASYKVILTDANDNLIWTADPADPFEVTYSILDPLPVTFIGTTSGSGSAYTLDSNIGLTSYSENQTYLIQFHATSLADPTLDIDGFGIKDLMKYDNNGTQIAVEAGDIEIGQTYMVRYDGTGFVLLSPVAATSAQVTTGTNTANFVTPASLTTFLNSITARGETYTVNQAYTVNGVADYINKLSDTTISFDIDDGTSFSNWICTYPDGSIQTLTTLANITDLSANGTYIVVKEKAAANADATLSIITESMTAPSVPNDGDYWLDISQKPFVPYKRISGSWVITQFVKLGEVTKTGGVLGTPISYALNGYYETTQDTLTNATLYSFNHNIGILQLKTIKYIQNKTAEYGYNIGDRVYNAEDGNSGIGSAFYGTVITTTNNIVYITVGSSGVGSINKSTGSTVDAFTTANWSAGLIIKRGF
jgi:hypothetical protein